MEDLVFELLMEWLWIRIFCLIFIFINVGPLGWRVTKRENHTETHPRWVQVRAQELHLPHHKHHQSGTPKCSADRSWLLSICWVQSTSRGSTRYFITRGRATSTTTMWLSCWTCWPPWLLCIWSAFSHAYWDTSHFNRNQGISWPISWYWAHFVFWQEA